MAAGPAKVGPVSVYIGDLEASVWELVGHVVENGFGWHGGIDSKAGELSGVLFGCEQIPRPGGSPPDFELLVRGMSQPIVGLFGLYHNLPGAKRRPGGGGMTMTCLWDIAALQTVATP
ncbi:hypothetical protein PoMZ_07863 [Pyricularia oryzae]|uniref:Uncharacterized protein n=1 Tax=Pyricularia oryzae TaxID=318829 RepID=A0A4P7NG62_PYROR|nr:hypothetical protein PoMZ_07863 [Pyricularia oryzae]